MRSTLTSRHALVELSRRGFLRRAFAAGVALTAGSLVGSARALAGGGERNLDKLRLGAVTVPPSTFPLRFRQLVAFTGDFGPGDLVNPKGVAYSEHLRQVIVSLSPWEHRGEDVQILNSVAPDGSRAVFSPVRMNREIESLLTVVPSSGAAVTVGGFSGGDVFVPTVAGRIARLSPDGFIIANPWVDLGTTLGFWGGLAFDLYGAFSGQLLALTYEGRLYRVNSVGQAALIVDLQQADVSGGGPLHTEGVTVAPPSFGPFARQALVGSEGLYDNDPLSGNVYTIDAQGRVGLLADIGRATEDIQFVPALGGTYYQCELNFKDSSLNRLLVASASQFLTRLRSAIVVNELDNEFWEIAWDGSQYTQSRIGRVPGPWTTTGFDDQGTELEAGCFAVLPPSIPRWTDWAPVPGGGVTDRAPNVSADASGNLHLLVKGIRDRRVYVNSMAADDQRWTGWREVPPGGLTTNYPIASALQDQVLYAFAVRDAGYIVYKALADQDGTLLNDPWTPVPGDGRTDVAVGAARIRGRLVLCAKGIVDQALYLNERATVGHTWTGWFPVPGGQTNASPALAEFQHELYLFAKGLTSGLVLTRARILGGDWTQWAPIPGTGVTDAAVAVASAGGQLYLFVKGVIDRAPYVNISSETGTWSGWRRIPNAGSTNAALAAAASGGIVYLFAKGIADNRVYMRTGQP